MRLLVLAIFIVLVEANPTGDPTTKDKYRNKIVTYWGQNGIWNRNKDPKNFEKGLLHFCERSNYDVINLSFLHVFFDPANKDSMPRLNFAFHCRSPINATYPSLLRCPDLEVAIRVCHENGKRVYIALGGDVGPYGFKNKEEAEVLAYRVYHLFLAGTELKDLRPFGSEVLDGVNLNIVMGGSEWYTEFVTALRRIEAAKGMHRHTSISVATQCFFPDSRMGPSTGMVLGDLPQEFDEIYVQFRNTLCNSNDPGLFLQNFVKWLKFAESLDNTHIYLGVPAEKGASSDVRNYRTPTDLNNIYEKIDHHDRFGGFMLWDASFDQNNVINGKVFSEHIKQVVEETFVPPPPVAGGYSDWESWGRCSVTCEWGSQTRTRTCSEPFPENGGLTCEEQEIGVAVQDQRCNAGSCKVSGRYTPWEDWSRCSVTCGNGTRTRTRSCSNPSPENGGETCLQQNLGPVIQTETCYAGNCKGGCERRLLDGSMLSLTEGSGFAVHCNYECICHRGNVRCHVLCPSSQRCQPHEMATFSYKYNAYSRCSPCLVVKCVSKDSIYSNADDGKVDVEAGKDFYAP